MLSDILFAGSKKPKTNNEPSIMIAGGSPAGKVRVTTDGTLWTTIDAKLETENVQGLAHGNGVFVAVGGVSGRISSSPDGINWTLRLPPIGEQFWDVVWSGSFFIAISYQGSIYKSLDGIIWTKIKTFNTVTYGGLNSVAVNELGFIVIGTSTGKIFTSPDGVNFTQRNTPFVGTQKVTLTYALGEFIAVSQYRVAVSPDGINWVLQYTFTGANNNDDFLRYANGFFFCGGNGVLKFSQDLLTWKELVINSGTSLCDVIYFKGNYYTCGWYYVYVSANLKDKYALNATGGFNTSHNALVVG